MTNESSPGAPTPSTSDPASVLGRLLDDSHFTPPGQLGSLLAKHARDLGIDEAVIYLVSIEQRALCPLDGEGVPVRETLDVDTTIAGRAYRTMTTINADGRGEPRLWLPMLDGTTRLGVLEIVGGPGVPEAVFRQLAALMAELLVSRNLYGDHLVRTRRERPVSLAAELQWSILPPQTFADGCVTLSAVLEPAYDIAGDSFDYAFNGDVANFALIDAMGHGFEATLLATVAISSYRHARRQGYGLAETYTAMERAITSQFGHDRFVTAILGELQGETGQLWWLNCGHPAPMLVRQGKHVGALECEPTLPIGFGGTVAEVAHEALEPDDHLLFYTDGLVEARSPVGDFFGDDRLADLLERAINADVPAPETARRLVHAVLDHQQGRLLDDATALLMNWNGPQSRAGL